jgi:hypothetical protein
MTIEDWKALGALRAERNIRFERRNGAELRFVNLGVLANYYAEHALGVESKERKQAGGWRKVVKALRGGFFQRGGRSQVLYLSEHAR